MSAISSHQLAERIICFLHEIGIDVELTVLTGTLFLPGILVQNGKLLVDQRQLDYPGDLLHEAGHLAVVPASLRGHLSGEVSLPGVNIDAIEAQAMAWSYAALTKLGLDPGTVFHEGGYKGQSESLLLNFSLGVFIGVSSLQEWGMTATAERASTLGVQPYPHMLRWLRD
jgi:hypothetical protein